MNTPKFLFIYHMTSPGPVASPEQMQEMLKHWDAWKNEFKQHIVDLGDGLKPGGKLLANGVVTDGPFPESKEVVAGYSIITAASFEQALVVARACPFAANPGGRIEIRELFGR